MIPCHCTRCCNVDTAVVELAWGTYTGEFCWQDWEAQAEKCHVEEIVIPSPRSAVELSLLCRRAHEAGQPGLDGPQMRPTAPAEPRRTLTILEER